VAIGAHVVMVMEAQDRERKLMESRKWRYEREHITSLSQLDEQLTERGNRGWELATVIHGKDTSPTEEGNILAPEGWTIIFKQPAV